MGEYTETVDNQTIPTLSPKAVLKQRLHAINPDFRYYKSLYNTIPDLIVVTDGDHVLDANASFVRFFSEWGVDVFDPQFNLSNIFEKVDKYGFVYEDYEQARWYETILRHDKEYYRVAIAGADKVHNFNIAIESFHPADDIFIVTLTDITEMVGYKNMLEENYQFTLQDKEETQYLLQQYDNAINVAMLVSKSGLDGKITYANTALCRTLKYDRSELIGKILMFCVSEESPEGNRSIWETIESGHIWKGILQNADKEGGIHYFDTTVVPIKDRAGNVVELMKIRHDITEMVRAKEEAIQTLQLKTKFFDQISHELRTPLNAVINFTDQALENFEEMFEDEILRELVKVYLDRAYKNSQNLLHLINSLLDMAKLQSGKETFAMERYEAVQMVRETYENCSGLNKSSDVEYRFKSDVSFAWINCDPLKFRQILTNLISNAFKFTQSGYIEIRLSENESECQIDVEDTGRGIAAEKLSLIFEPFRQAGLQDPGTGLGLSIVKEYAEAMGISLDVRSREGFGSCFTLKMKKIESNEGGIWNI